MVRHIGHGWNAASCTPSADSVEKLVIPIKFVLRKDVSRVHQVAEEEDIRAESVYRVEQCSSWAQPPYQVTLKVDGRPISFELDTGAAVTLITEKHVPRNVTLIPPKSLVRSYTGQSLEIKGLYTAEVEYQGGTVLSPSPRCPSQPAVQPTGPELDKLLEDEGSSHKEHRDDSSRASGFN